MHLRGYVLRRFSKRFSHLFVWFFVIALLILILCYSSVSSLRLWSIILRAAAALIFFCFSVILFRYVNVKHSDLYSNGFDQRIARQRLLKHGTTRNNRTTGLCNPLLGNSPVNTFQHMCRAKMEEAVFSMRWRHQQYGSCAFCTWSVPKVYRRQPRSFAASRKMSFMEIQELKCWRLYFMCSSKLEQWVVASKQ
jgi:hypothetical protein